VALLRRYLEHEDREHFVTLMLDVKNQVIGIHTVSIGNLNSAIVSPREVFKAAILANAASIILGHNHPSGDTTPSPEDIQVTEVLHHAGTLLHIDVLDHVIIGEEGAFCSLRRDGKMPRD
jgi:DNA repair protein RadC